MIWGWARRAPLNFASYYVNVIIALILVVSSIFIFAAYAKLICAPALSFDSGFQQTQRNNFVSGLAAIAKVRSDHPDFCQMDVGGFLLVPFKQDRRSLYEAALHIHRPYYDFVDHTHFYSFTIYPTDFKNIGLSILNADRVVLSFEFSGKDKNSEITGFSAHLFSDFC